MKGKISIFTFLLVTGVMFSQATIGLPQWNGASNSTGTIYRTGDVGIGTTSPTEKLQVAGTVLALKGNFDESQPNGSVYLNSTDRNIKCNVLRAGTSLSTSGSIFNLLDFPESNLNPQAQSFMGIEDRDYKSRFRYYANTGGSSEQIYYDKNQSSFYSLSENGNGSVYLKLSKENSYVSIGTDSFQDGTDTYKLSVNGNVRAESVKVYTDWADFVFEPSYDLPTLTEVEEFINANGHLKDIPSAAEVEANGIDLGEVNKLLLQKIEELTLYVIELNKEVQELKQN